MAKKNKFYLVQALTSEGFRWQELEAPTAAAAKRMFFNLHCSGLEIKDLKIERIGDNVKQARLTF